MVAFASTAVRGHGGASEFLDVIDGQQPLPTAVWDKVVDSARLEAVAALAALGAEDDRDFDRLTRLAARALSTPVALVTMLDDKRQWFRARYGTDLKGTPVEQSFCAHTIAAPAPQMVINDASLDPRFSQNPLVTGAPGIRFYAGAPIIVHGQRVGSVCAIDLVPHDEVPEEALQELEMLAGLASSLFELKDEARVRALTAANLMREEWRHALTLEAGRVGSWVWDTRSGEVVGNDIHTTMFGLAPDVSHTFADLLGAIHADDVARVETALEGSVRDGTDYESEFRIAGTERWLVGRGRVYQRDADGRAMVLMGVNVDITEQRQAAEHTRLLLRELNHRVKNTLAMIQSLARQTLKRNTDPRSFIDSFSGRLRTLSDAHSMLSDRDWSGIGLVDLIRSQVSPYALDPDLQLLLEGEDVSLPPDHALGLGMVLHELSSNAVKYGSLSRARGRVSLHWSVGGSTERRLELRWKESEGPLVEPSPPNGLGARLIERGLDKILDSAVELRFPADGAEALISMPLGSEDPR